MQDSSTYLIINAAKTSGEISMGYKLNPKFEFLSHDKTGIDAVCLFDFQFLSSFAAWFQKDGYNKAWGIFAMSPATREELALHFRKFLIVNSEDGDEMYFRLYDPRVLRVFLPSCDEDQLKKFFGPVKKFAMESDDSNFIIQFELQKNHLVSTRIPAMEFWNNSNNFSDVTFPVDQAEKNKEEIEQEKPMEKKPGSHSKWNFLIDDN
jgi:uncharacterized protein DUF4123